MPHASTALQVIVSVWVPAQLPAVVISLTTCTLAELHTSLAVGGVNEGVAVHSIVALGPCPPIVGGVISLTVIA